MARQLTLPPVEKRLQQSTLIREQFPDRCPMYITRFEKERELPDLDKTKFLVPDYVTVRELVNIIRRRLQVRKEQCVLIIVNQSRMPAMSMTVGELYTQERAADGFLYIEYTSQVTFG